MTKFEKDDKVRLRSDLKGDAVYGGVTLQDYMVEAIVGKELRIEDISGGTDITLKGYDYIFTAEMLELVKDTHPSDCKCGACATGKTHEPISMEPEKEKEYIVIYEHEEEKNRIKGIGELAYFYWARERGKANLKDRITLAMLNGQEVHGIFEVTKELTKKITVDIEELK